MRASTSTTGTVGCSFLVALGLLLLSSGTAFVLSPPSSKVGGRAPQRCVAPRGGILPPLPVSSAEPTALAQVATADDDTVEAATTEEVATPEEVEAAAAAAVEIEGDDAASSKASIQRERHTLFVGNLDFGTTDEDLRELFQQYGTVELVNLPRDRNSGRPRGFAFVDMATNDAADAASAALDGMELRSREIRVAKSVPKEDLPPRAPRTPNAPRAGSPPISETPEGAKKIYVGNIPFETTTEEIVAHYAQYGEVLEAYIPTDRSSGAGRGFAFVTMKDDDATAAIEATNGSEFQGRRIVVSLPLPPGEKAPARRNQVKLYVGNLSFYTIADTLVDAFSEFGTVIDCYLPEDPNTGAARGFGFVTMDPDDAEKAVRELDGCEIDGRVVRVNVAQPKGGGSSGPRRGGGGGGGGGGRRDYYSE